MLTNSKIALSLVLVLATVSAAAAAPKRASHHQTTIQQQVPLAASHLSFNLVPSTESGRSIGPANQSSNISPLEFEGLARLIEAIDEIGAGN